jgi:hypothetical protein
MRDALASLANSVPPRLYVQEGRPYVPLLLRKNAGRDEVVRYLVEQLNEIVGLLRQGIPDVGSDRPPPPEESTTAEARPVVDDQRQR